jgi:hypothetical protein
VMVLKTGFLESVLWLVGGAAVGVAVGVYMARRGPGIDLAAGPAAG